MGGNGKIWAKSPLEPAGMGGAGIGPPRPPTPRCRARAGAAPGARGARGRADPCRPTAAGRDHGPAGAARRRGDSTRGLRRRGMRRACKPGSVQGPAGPLGGHSSGAGVAPGFARSTTAGGAEAAPRGAPGQGGPRPAQLDLAPGGACRAAPVAGGAVSSCLTVSPLPAPRGRRSDLCGAFPRVSPAGRYPAPCLRGARTFLAAPAGTARPPGPPHPGIR